MNGYNYGNRSPYQRVERVADIVSAEQAEENKKMLEGLIERSEVYDEQNYGEERTLQRISKQYFELKISQIGQCKVEGRLIIYCSKTKRIAQIKRLYDSDPSGEEAAATIEMWLKGDLLNPLANRNFLKILSLPFMVEYREKDNKKYIALSYEQGDSTKKIVQKFFIREI